MPLRETRRFKTKGFAISFGDFMLPLVGLVAIGLLFVAGKIFFFSDFQTNSQPIPVSIAPPDTSRADAEESASGPSSEASTVVQIPSQGATTSANLMLDLDDENRAQNTATDHQDQDGAPQSVNSSREENTENTREIIIITAAPEPTSPQATPEQQPVPNVEPNPAASIPAQPVQIQEANWMVQIGAYSTNAAAEAVLGRITQAGYRAIVVPGRTWNRVLVQAGPTRQDAMNLAARLGRTGYPGAFPVPPRRP